MTHKEELFFSVCAFADCSPNFCSSSLPIPIYQSNFSKVFFFPALSLPQGNFFYFHFRNDVPKFQVLQTGKLIAVNFVKNKTAGKWPDVGMRCLPEEPTTTQYTSDHICRVNGLKHAKNSVHAGGQCVPKCFKIAARIHHYMCTWA